MTHRLQVLAGQWERGHFSHHFWSEEGKKLGSIRLECARSHVARAPTDATLYHWNCAHLRGTAFNLKEAKSAVEMAHFTGLVQMSLFPPDSEINAQPTSG